MKQLILLPVFLVAAACAGTETSRRAAPEMTMPAMKTFSGKRVAAPKASNAQIARDFLGLAFELENGRPITTFTRFEGPITVAVTGKKPYTLNSDLSRLLGRLRNEAAVPIKLHTGSGPASITIETVPMAQIQRAAPTAACFVRPNVSSWAEYRKRRNDTATNWPNIKKRERMAIFIPNNVSPQEVRDCLHEEIAQALGPLNDLYRLSDSIFNDDNLHSTLTGFDMLILRAHYDPGLQNGMTRQEVAARIPNIIRRLNPRGGPAGIAPPAPKLNGWKKAILTATTPGGAKSRRLGAAERAVLLAQRGNPNDPRLAYSYYIQGRLLIQADPDKALASFLKAGQIYQNRPDTRLQEAHVALQVAAFQLAIGRSQIARALVDQNLTIVEQAEHASLLSLMLLVKSEAHALEENRPEAARARQDALAWGLYGYGTKKAVLERVGEILSISPRNRKG